MTSGTTVTRPRGPTQPSCVWVLLTRIVMPDTKSGRERKGSGKRRQLESHLNRRELEADDEPPEPARTEIDSEFLTDPDRSDG